MKRISLITLTMLLCLAITTQAQQPKGKYAFLRTTNSARVAALGGLPLPLSDGDIQLSAFNPSSINEDMNNSLSLSYVDYYTDINYLSAQYSHTFDNIGSFVGTVQYHNFGTFQETSESGIEMGDFTCAHYSINIGWGRSLSERWTIGAAMKFAALQDEAYHSGALAVDVATSYHSSNDWLFTLAARNIGAQLYNNIDNDNGSLPWSLDLAASRRLEHLPLTFIFWYDDIQKWNKLYDDPLDLEGNYDPMTGQMITDGKVEHFAKNLVCHLGIGGELNLGKNLVLRAAYNYGQRHNMTVPQNRTLVGFSVGFGVKIKKFQIDYARSRQNIMASPNYLTLTVKL